jgi:hypothetical protein
MPLRVSRIILLIVFGIVLPLALSFLNQLSLCRANHYDQRNLYVGTTTLDALGEATIEIPGAVVKANSSFSYQVKSMNDPMSGAKIDNAFKLRSAC